MYAHSLYDYISDISHKLDSCKSGIISIDQILHVGNTENDLYPFNSMEMN